MIKKLLFALSTLFIINNTFSQYKNLSKNAQISIITVSSGKTLHERFGHTTIRVKDTNFDLAYNYGIFDFNAPNFYVNFIKGRLLYKLQSYPFYYFVKGYKKDKRWIKEQVLNLNQKEKQLIFEYLENNVKPKNANYLYDPFFNNCATKPREILEFVLKDSIIFNDTYIVNNKSFRQLMNHKIHWNTWGSFGINLALGSKLDNIATTKEYMYLPDYVYSGFNNAKIIHNNSKENLISSSSFILDYKEIRQDIISYNPLTICIILLLLGLFMTKNDLKNNKRSRWFDFILFFSTGLIGVLILFLWFFTDHSTTPTNFNFLWAFAPNLIIAFYLLNNQTKSWIKKYIIFLICLLLLIPVIWIGKIQELSLSSIPLITLILVRYISLVKKLY